MNGIKCFISKNAVHLTVSLRELSGFNKLLNEIDNHHGFKDKLQKKVQTFVFLNNWILTNFSKDIEATISWPFIRKTDIVPIDLALKLYRHNVQVKCDLIFTYADIRIPYNYAFQYPLTRDGDYIICFWLHKQNDYFSRKSIMSECVQFCLALFVFRLPTYVLLQIFDNSLYAGNPFALDVWMDVKVGELIAKELALLHHHEKVQTIQKVMQNRLKEQ